jgi:hypothetical protein
LRISFPPIYQISIDILNLPCRFQSLDLMVIEHKVSIKLSNIVFKGFVPQKEPLSKRRFSSYIFKPQITAGIRLFNQHV